MTVLLIIMIVDVIAIAFVMWLGTRHDHHHDIQTSDASEAVKMLRSKYAPAPPLSPVVSETPKAEEASSQPE